MVLIIFLNEYIDVAYAMQRENSKLEHFIRIKRNMEEVIDKEVKRIEKELLKKNQRNELRTKLLAEQQAKKVAYHIIADA